MKLRKKRKAQARLEGRIQDWLNISGDCRKKHPSGYRKPGSMKS